MSDEEIEARINTDEAITETLINRLLIFASIDSDVGLHSRPSALLLRNLALFSFALADSKLPNAEPNAYTRNDVHIFVRSGYLSRSLLYWLSQSEGGGIDDRLFLVDDDDGLPRSNCLFLLSSSSSFLDLSLSPLSIMNIHSL